MKIKPLQWSNVREPNELVRYHHVIAETPFGMFLITWKGWKERDTPTVDASPCGDVFIAGVDLEDTKRLAEEEYRKCVIACLES